MRLPAVAICLITVLLSACGTTSAIKPVEYLDDRTAMTVGSLKEPIELVPSLRQGGLHVITNLGKRLSFAYLGPVEWDRSGSIVYGLWVHIAPGTDRPIADIRSNAALTIVLDNGTRVLTPKGQGRVLAQEILARRILVEFEDGRRLPVAVDEILTKL